MQIQNITAAIAIEESIQKNEIVHITFDKKDYEYLKNYCFDYVDCEGYIEFWGEEDSKHQWRVHIHRIY